MKIPRKLTVSATEAIRAHSWHLYETYKNVLITIEPDAQKALIAIYEMESGCLEN